MSSTLCGSGPGGLAISGLGGSWPPAPSPAKSVSWTHGLMDDPACLLGKSTPPSRPPSLPGQPEGSSLASFPRGPKLCPCCRLGCCLRAGDPDFKARAPAQRLRPACGPVPDWGPGSTAHVYALGFSSESNRQQAILTRGMFRLGPAKLLAKTEEAKSAESAQDQARGPRCGEARQASAGRRGWGPGPSGW